ncbi:stalk domain-containing protein [Paenibacillus sp. y28]|uniref:stalk domain-containing protein n=1 Tax=Paenibacillus sp. y28 TaxID=3129110 RepID=UPI003017ABFF
MNKSVKRLGSLVVSCAMLGTALLLPQAASAAALTEDVKVQVNTRLVDFPDAQPFIDDAHRLQVPVRFVSEQLGFQVSAEPVGNAMHVLLTSKDQRIELKTGSEAVTVNGKETALDTEPVLEKGRVYLPLRLLSDLSGIRIQWDPSNFIAILNEDGNYHAPAWYAPRYDKVEEFTASAYSAAPEENGGYGARDYMGNSLKLGTVAVDPSVIPLGSRLYIEGYSYNGLPAEGMFATATDTGGSIKGNRIDIFVPDSPVKLKAFGLQKVKVYRLTP